MGNTRKLRNDLRMLAGVAAARYDITEEEYVATLYEIADEIENEDYKLLFAAGRVDK